MSLGKQEKEQWNRLEFATEDMERNIMKRNWSQVRSEGDLTSTPTT